MARIRLNPEVAVRVEFVDRTSFGSPVAARPEQHIRGLFPAVFERFIEGGLSELVAGGTQLLAEAVGGPGFDSVAERSGPAWRIRREVLHPDPELAPPRFLSFASSKGGPSLRATLPADAWPAARRVVSALAGRGCDPHDGDVPEPFRRLLAGLGQAGLVVEDDDQLDVGSRLPAGTDLSFLGHNTVVVRSERSTVVLDPYLFPHSPAHPPGYQPFRVADVGHVDAVLITHSHPDHFDPGSLLQFPLETRVVVPVLERETLLAVDMARRLRELGFTDVVSLAWGQRTSVGDVEVEALPFFGEQPTDGDVLHPDVRNNGNTYVVRTPRIAAAFLADSGRDGAGDVKHVAEASRRRDGPVDVVFSGYRGWITYPVQLVLSSVGRYILFVPPWLWAARQRLMNDVHDAVDVAERWGARWLVPYADGGAPWHWNVGLGPRLDGQVRENPGFDPLPDRLVDAARQRVVGPDGSTTGSSTRVLLLRPGDSVIDARGDARRVRVDGYAWPYDGAGVDVGARAGSGAGTDGG